MTACIGEPVSWLRLESFALGALDPATASHLEACQICQRCLDQIRGDTVALPPLAWAAPRANRAKPDLPEAADPRSEWTRGTRRTPRWWWAAAAAAGLAAIAAIVLIVRVPRPGPSGGLGAVAVKGVGEVALELVRERAGAIRSGATTYAHGDRWKVIVTCPPAVSVRVEITVSDGATVDRPLAPAQILCGNGVVIPGAFAITGIATHRVCASVSATQGAEVATACATLRAE